MGRQAAFGKQTRQRVAMEAARIMAEEGVVDFHAAKRKAAQRLGVTLRQDMPANQEIEDQLRAYQSLFQAGRHDSALNKFRNTALEAMRFLKNYEPRLVGSVLDGTAGEHAVVQLHLFVEMLEGINLFLMEKGIPFETGMVSVKYASGERSNYPRLTFLAGDVPIELVIFPLEGLRQAPCSTVSGRPMVRATVKTVEELVAAGSGVEQA